MRMHHAFAASSCLALLSLAPLANATIIVPMSIEEMVVEAAAIVQGKVLARQSAWDAQHRRIYTFTEIQVVDRMFGQMPERIVVRTLGGAVGEVGMRVSGTPEFADGEDVVLFLRADPLERQHFQVIGMSQGKYRLQPGANGQLFAVPSTAGLAFVRPNNGTLKVDEAMQHPQALSLDALRQRVTAALKTKAQIVPTQPQGPAVVTP